MKLLIDNTNKTKSGIYKITNTITDMVYIGSAYNFYNRFRTHKSTLKNNRHANDHLQKSYKKYGEENFTFSIIEMCAIEELENKEAYYLNLYFGKHCYNMNKNVQCRFMNNRFNKKHALVSPNNICIEHYGNLKTLAKFLNTLDNTISESKFYDGMFKLVNGKREHYKGWRLVENAHIDITTPTKSKYNGKLYETVVISPDGIEYGPIKNLAKFCYEHNIPSAASFSNLINRKLKYYKGWYVKDINIPLKHNEMIYEILLESPTGELFGPITNLTKFAREHDLSQGGLRGFITGRLKTYKGWKILKSLENKNDLLN
jgi:group I intron endonuclease